jgi:ABC-type Fe3+ transport system permease subunit
MPATMRDIIFWSALSCVFAFMLFFGINLGIYEPAQVSVGLSPRAYPRAVMLLLLCISLYLLLESCLSHKQAQARNKEPDKTDEEEARPTRDLLLTYAIILGYSLSVPYLGIVPASALAFALFTRLNGERRTGRMLCIGAALAVGLYYFFLYVAAVPMPPGPFGGIV